MEHLSARTYIKTQSSSWSANIRHYIPKPFLKTICYSVFNYHLIYACQTWAQSKTELFNKTKKIQDKALHIINFLPNTAPVSKIYKTSKNLKLSDYISLQKCLTSGKLL